MLFNSHEFIFLFLPLAFAVYTVLRSRAVFVSLVFLAAASLLFYAWWRPQNLLIIGPSLIVNYLVARELLAARREENAAKAKLLLTVGIVFNVCVLGYFKYITFFQASVNVIFGTDFTLTYVVLPLGISFITFQKIAFLVDIHGGRIDRFTLQEFLLFILFFPQLIAGPIVHFREMMPQFQALTTRFDSQAITVGMTLFVFGLAKKVLIADGLSEHVTPVYSAAAAGEVISFLPGWIAALGFTLQIYFDFSAYSDMAAGLARCFGVRLPLNFDSPLKASSIIDFWERWHITLTRFLTAYVFNPIALRWTRQRMLAIQEKGESRESAAATFFVVLAVPTMLTMFLSGLWHGAGYMFVLWGLLHGVYLVINHGWRRFVQPVWGDRVIYRRTMPVFGFLLTFLSVVVAMVFFRSGTLHQAKVILEGMIGLGGVVLPASLFGSMHDEIYWPSVFDVGAVSIRAIAWTALATIGALALPNTLQMLANYEPVIGYEKSLETTVGRFIRWRQSLIWMLLTTVLASACIWNLGDKSEFLYWQF